MPGTKSWQVACAIGVATGIASAADWAQFRGPGGSGTSADRTLPVRWSTDENIAWKTDLPGRGDSSPITFGDRIFLTCFRGYGENHLDPGDMNRLERLVVCINRADGKIRWQKTVPSTLPEQPYTSRMHWHGYATSTPAADKDRLYAFFGKSGVFAFDHDGKPLWHANVGSKFQGWGSAASLVLYKNLVIVNACSESDALIALDKRTGKEVWRAGGMRESWNTPLLVEAPNGKTELVVAIFGKVLGFEPATGKQLWSCDAISYYVAPSMIAHDGVVYCTGGRNYEFVAVRTGGRGDVTQSHLLWKGNRGSNVSSPVYHDGHLYWANDTRNIVYCANAKTGAVVYEERLDPPVGNIYASALVGGGNVYYLSRYGTTYVVAANPTFAVVARNELKPDKFFNASPAASNGQLLLRSDRALYCIGSK